MAPFYGWGSTAFRFTLLLGASKGFMKTFKTFIEPFEVAQRSLKKKKISVNFLSSSGIETGRVNKARYKTLAKFNNILRFMAHEKTMFLDSIMTNAHKMAKHLFEILQ